jgi:hypothetical protein
VLVVAISSVDFCSLKGAPSAPASQASLFERNLAKSPHATLEVLTTSRNPFVPALKNLAPLKRLLLAIAIGRLWKSGRGGPTDF